MTLALRWSAAVLAGLCWVFLARLAGDAFSPWALTLPLFAPPIVVAALRLPRRAGVISLTLVSLLYDAGTGTPFGITASLALPAHALLFLLRNHVSERSPLTLAAIATAITPMLHLAGAFAIHLSTGRPLTTDLAGFVTEVVVAALLSGVATPWLASFTESLLTTFGADVTGEIYPA